MSEAPPDVLVSKLERYEEAASWRRWCDAVRMLGEELLEHARLVSSWYEAARTRLGAQRLGAAPASLDHRIERIALLRV